MPHTTSHINSPFNIGAVCLPNRLVQAPLAGISGRAFRLQARRFGAGLLMTEMVSSYGVKYRNARTLAMLKLEEAEHPVALQLFGSDPAVMAAAAMAAEAAGADIVDVNMGCPVRKVVKTGAGVALMADEALAEKIVAEMVEAVSIPVTVKLRAGAGRRVSAPQLAQRLAAAGAAAVCIHPRTGAQMWKGGADHAVTVEAAARCEVPVIASGDIASPDAALQLLEAGCAAVMPGRASLGNPWLFADLLAGRRGEVRPLDEVLAEMERFFRDLAGELGEQRAVRQMRKFYGWYLRPFRLPAELRNELRRTEDFAQAAALIRQGIGARQRN